MSLSAVQGDITRIEVDAVVNAANRRLVPGGGVDGAIHRAGGPSIEAECAAIVSERGPLGTGDAVITGAGELPARHVIHTAGPVWGQDDPTTSLELLSACYRNSLDLADANGCTTIAFPNISTGAFGFPIVLAANTAIASVRIWMTERGADPDVVFVCFTPDNHELYRIRLSQRDG